MITLLATVSPGLLAEVEALRQQREDVPGARRSFCFTLFGFFSCSFFLLLFLCIFYILVVVRHLFVLWLFSGCF